FVRHLRTSSWGAMKNVLTTLVLLLAAGAGQAQRVGSEFLVNTYTPNNQKRPAVAADSTGAFVVVWQSQQPGDGSAVNVFGQRYSSAGAPLGGEFRLSPFTVDPQSQYPAVASDALGNFVAVWQHVEGGGFSSVFGQRWASSGAPLGGTFQA